VYLHAILAQKIYTDIHCTRYSGTLPEAIETKIGGERVYVEQGLSPLLYIAFARVILIRLVRLKDPKNNDI
jgi:hypothetical protein